MHRTVRVGRETSRETDIHRWSVSQIICKDLHLKCFKRRCAQEMTDANCAARMKRAKLLLQKFLQSTNDFVFFTDKKMFSVTSPDSRQNKVIGIQLGFKRRHSTAMCTMVLKETLTYYSADGGTAFCTFLEVTKAFDRVDYCKLFRLLIRRDIPSMHLRLLLNMYTNSMAHIVVHWNGVFIAALCNRTGH